jgi:hypothetical protein
MKNLLLISLMTGLLIGGPALADKPDRAGNRVEESRKGDSRGGAYFNDHQRTASRASTMT